MGKMNKWIEKLTKFGFKPEYYEEYEQVDCIINGVSFGVSRDDDEDALWFSIIFEPNKPMKEKEFKRINNMLIKENGPFEDLLLAEDGTVHVVIKKYFDDVEPDYLERIISAINNPNGTISYLKSISHVW